MYTQKKSSKSESKSLNESESGADEEDDDDDDEEGASYENIEGAYDPLVFNDQLNVGSEVKDLFQYIVRYKPHEIELMTTLKCFVPEYIPSIGEIDSFIKVHLPAPFIILTLPPFLLLILPYTCIYMYMDICIYTYTDPSS